MKTVSISIKVLFIIILSTLITCFNLLAGPASVKLEEGIYAENTLGDIDKAIQIYKELINDPNTSSEYKSKAKHYLNQANLKTELNSPKKTIDTKKEFDPTSDKIQNRWQNGLTRKWVNTRETDNQSKLSISSINMAEIQGKKYWCYEYRTIYEHLNFYSRLFFEIDTLKPVKSFIENNLSKTIIKYDKNKIELHLDHQGSNKVTHFNNKTNAIIYDPYQVSLLVEQLPIKEGFQTIVSFFKPQLNKPISIRITVPKKETVRVLAGTFECYLVTFEYKTSGNWKHSSSGKWTHSTSGWYSIKTGLLVKIHSFSSFKIVSELKEVAIKPVEIKDFKNGAL